MANRFVLLIACLGLAACSSPTAPDDPVMGAVLFYDMDPHVLVPDTVFAGQEFSVGISTWSLGLCFEQAGLAVEREGAVTIMTPRVRPASRPSCRTGVIWGLAHMTTLRFDDAGVARVAFRGRHYPSGGGGHARLRSGGPMSRARLLVLMASVVALACGSITDPRPEVMADLHHDGRAHVWVPDSVARGETFQVYVLTFGTRGCIQRARTVVEHTGSLTAVVIPYNYGARPGTSCQDILAVAEHTATLRFEAAGLARVSIQGRYATVDRDVVVH